MLSLFHRALLNQSILGIPSTHTSVQAVVTVVPQRQDLSDDQFCEKVGISKDGKLTIGGILMLGQRDVVQRYISNFWIDYLEIPGHKACDRNTSM